MKRSGTLEFVFFIVVFAMTAAVFVFFSLSIKDSSTEVSIKKTSAPTIVIDAGHGGEDGGTVGINGVYEKDLNLDISFFLRDMLTSRGYDVILTRSEDILLYDRSVDFNGRKKALDLTARVEIARKYEECVFISIHMNAFSDAKYSGLQVYYSKNDERSALLAEAIQALIKETLQPMNKRKTKVAGENIFILDKIESPAILIECGFLSNHEECDLLSTNKYKQKLALIISLAIEKYMSEHT